MSKVVLTVGPGQSMLEAARLMAERNVGAAVVIDPDAPGPGIITERDVIRAAATCDDLARERVADHAAERAVYASPDWSLERAADEMVRGRFRHLVVVDGAEVAGVLSMRDIVSCWVTDGASCEVE
jgi:CBS domain-containing protein